MKTIWGINIDDVSWEEIRIRVAEWMGAGDAKVITTPNAEILLGSRVSSMLRADLEAADLSLPDTFSVELALASAGTPLEHGRKPGVDVLLALLEVASEKGAQVAIVGSSKNAAAKAIHAMIAKHPQLKVDWVDVGEISAEFTEPSREITYRIDALAPRFVIVALGQGKQERFMQVYKNSVQKPAVWMGVGGALEMVGGSIRRAPKVWQTLGLEWAWRLLMQPSRLKRILDATIRFPLLIVSDRLKDRQFLVGVARVFRYLLHYYGQNTHRT